jgi:hypothetical protein
MDLYKLSPTRIVLLQIPRGPAADPQERAPGRFIESVSSRARVITLPSDLFRDLERPEIFVDGLHLNREGRALFTDRLTDRMAAILASN